MGLLNWLFGTKMAHCQYCGKNITSLGAFGYEGSGSIYCPTQGEKGWCMIKAVESKREDPAEVPQPYNPRQLRSAIRWGRLKHYSPIEAKAQESQASASPERPKVHPLAQMSVKK